ncbi:GHMP kinase [bacterium BFN5]|nr:GHMP kinase [bacterium BFN5]
MFACVKAPGSCGELVQGTLGGKNFLVTCPINLYSTAMVRNSSAPSLICAGNKVKEAIKKTMDYLSINSNFQLTVQSGLPQGKGMASSSADISAACQALALSVGKSLTPDEIAKIAISIEPTDGIFFPGIVMIDHIAGEDRFLLGNPPPITIAVFDAGGEVDTLYFNQRIDLKRLNDEKEPKVEQALHFVKQGILSGDAELIGRGATLSAIANQAILYKPCLETVINLAKQYGAIGVNAAHSGTVLGVLFRSDQLKHYADGIQAIQNSCPEINFIKTVQLISGGLRIVGESDEQP